MGWGVTELVKSFEVFCCGTKVLTTSATPKKHEGLKKIVHGIGLEPEDPWGQTQKSV